MPFVSEKLDEEYSQTIVEYGHLYGGIAFCICLTSVTRAKLNEKMAFPAEFLNSVYPELLLKGLSF